MTVQDYSNYFFTGFILEQDCIAWIHYSLLYVSTRVITPTKMYTSYYIHRYPTRSRLDRTEQFILTVIMMMSNRTKQPLLSLQLKKLV